MGADLRIVVRDGDPLAARLDRLLASDGALGSRRRAREALTTGKVDVDGHTASGDDGGRALAPGQVVEVFWRRPGTAAATVRARAHLDAAGLVILHQDDDVVAVDKPAGLLTDVADAEQARTRDSVKKRLAALLRGSGQQALVCHRIDRDTTGVVVFATNERAADALRGQFMRHEPRRIYRALVHGVPDAPEGTWEDFTVWERGAKRLKRVHERAPGAMPTRSSWRVVEAFERAALLEVRLDTGRRNQIRLQAALRHHPLVGERLYVSPRFRPELDAPRQLLHAAEVEVRHPRDHAPLAVASPLPPDFEALLAALRRG